MSIIMSWTPIADRMKTELTNRVRENDFKDKYVAIIYMGDNPASATYVRMKQKFAQDIGLSLKIIGQDNDIKNYDDLMDVVGELSYDDNCIGFMPQLPLAWLTPEQVMEVFDAIPPYKDIDGLSWGFIGQFVTEQIYFLGATPQAVFTLLDEYWYGNLVWKSVTIVWQSNLLGKPLVLGCMRRWASVMTFNSKSSDELVRSSCLQSDIIISCTGVVHRLDESYFRSDRSQVVIDVGRGKREWKPAWDVRLHTIIDKVAAYTPLPGWVWPLTIANLLMNVKRLYTKFN